MMRIKYASFVIVLLFISMSKTIEAGTDIEIKKISDLKYMVNKVQQLQYGLCVLKRADRDDFFHVNNKRGEIYLTFPKKRESERKIAEKVKQIAKEKRYKYDESASGRITIKSNGSMIEVSTIVETVLKQAFDVTDEKKLEFWCWEATQ